MRYKGIVEIMLKPDVPDVNGKAALGLILAAGFDDVIGVRIGKVIEVEFDCEPSDAAETLDQMAKQLLAHPVTEQYGYRLQFYGDQGWGETPMRYVVDENDTRLKK